jgi:hypothetical protein
MDKVGATLFWMGVVAIIAAPFWGSILKDMWAITTGW